MKVAVSNSLACVLVLCGSAALRGADTVAPPPNPPAPITPPAALSPQLVQALGELAGDDYVQRQQAVDKIQAALADAIGALIRQNDPEARNRMAGIMEYNAALSRWGLEALQLPPAQRAAVVAWAMAPRMAPLIARVYATHPEQRQEAIRELARNTDPNAGTLLARLICDEDATVRLMAMDAVRQRPATPVIVDALWNVAVGAAGPATYNRSPTMLNTLALEFNSPQLYGGRTLDERAAIGVLIGLKDAGVAARVGVYLEQHAAEKMSGGQGGSVFLGNNPLRGVLALAQSYHARQAIAPLMKIVAGPVSGTSNINFGGHPTCLTNRTEAMAAICLISGLKPEDYDLHKSPQINQWCTTDAAAEKQAATKLIQWYQDHRAEFAAPTAPAAPLAPVAH